LFLFKIIIIKFFNKSDFTRSLYLEIKRETILMQKKVFGCGRSPAYGPIPRDAKLWQV
jgi:hypothetical protein